MKQFNPNFSLRSFLTFCVGITLLVAIRAYALAIGFYGWAILCYVLYWTGTKVVANYWSQNKSILRKRRTMADPIMVSPIILPICFLVAYQFLCYYVVLASTAKGIILFWCSPVVSGVCLADFIHVILLAYQFYLYVCFYGNCYGTGQVLFRDCGMTACISVMLLASHFSVPRG